MTARTIRTIGDPILSKVSDKVEEVDEGTRQLIQDMVDTLKASGGVGLAAPQVGFNKRIVVIDCTEIPGGNPLSENADDNFFTMINPETKLKGNRIRWREACLSIPGVSGMVERNENIEVSFLNNLGTPVDMEIKWPLSGIVQHECDHLEGILYPDRMSQLTRNMLYKKLEKIKKKFKKAYENASSEKRGSSRPKNLKAVKSRRQTSKAARVSRRASRSR